MDGLKNVVHLASETATLMICGEHIRVFFYGVSWAFLQNSLCSVFKTQMIQSSIQ